MNAIQQKCRPKHQVLILKCYPRTTKGAVDVKPNSSELSYLLFYATSRRSKIQKIGAFLEKKTASDVWRLRIGNVQVTLGILTALLEKSHRDVALIAPCVLKILDLILRSNDITMIESSLPTFGAFCEHPEASSLFADQTYLQPYKSVVSLYAQLAATHQVPGKGPSSRPVQIRWRTAGLEAIKSVSASDSLATAAGRQIDVITPVILENLWSADDDFVDMLLQRVSADEKVESDKPLRRRTSVGTVGTADTNPDANPLVFGGTAGDADKMAEENLGVLAMHCLKSIFVIPNRVQIHQATTALLKFILGQVQKGEQVFVQDEAGSLRDGGWAIKIYGLLARWAPVQDRYVVLLPALDTLTRMPIKDDNLQQHIVLTAMITSLLRSDTNLIGLSIMDVLLALVKHIRRLLQLPRGNAGEGSVVDEKADADQDGEESPKRADLLERLEHCIGALATHVYYADQISDMVSAIITRIRPTRSSSTTGTPQGEKTEVSEGGPGVSTVDLADSQTSLEAFFSHNQGRLSALRVVKKILLVANPKTKIAGNMGLSRNKVPMHVWEGTHWLLRGPDGQVRKAYADALVTWLDRETIAADARAHDPSQIQPRTSLRGSRDMPANHSTTQRSASSVSNRERQARHHRSQFLPLLHLTIYDNALQYVDYDNDMALLHVLLTKLVFNMGVNAVRYGVPMIFRLQEEVQELELPVHKVRVAALCHGYFWALTEKFDFEPSPVGRAIQNEISRRRSKGFWINDINVPCPPISSVGPPGFSRPSREWDLSALETEELLPFDDRTSLVECIATGYEESCRSPPLSPAASPGRVQQNPMVSSNLSSTHAPDGEPELPSSFREQMQTDWSRDTVMLALAAASKSESIAGSRAGTASAARNRLTITSMALNGNGHGGLSPRGSRHKLRPHSAHVPGEHEGLNAASKLRKSSVRSGISPSTTSVSGRQGIASVEQLKMVLSGNMSPRTIGLPNAEDEDDDSAESMLSYDYSPSELSFNPQAQNEQGAATGADLPRRSPSASHFAPVNSTTGGLDNESVREVNEDDVPPVPALPNLGSLRSRSNVHLGDTLTQDHAAKHSRRNIPSRGGESFRSTSVRSRQGSSKAMDLQDLLMGIDSRSGEGSLGNLTKPPY